MRSNENDRRSELPPCYPAGPGSCLAFYYKEGKSSVFSRRRCASLHFRSSSSTEQKPVYRVMRLPLEKNIINEFRQLKFYCRSMPSAQFFRKKSRNTMICVPQNPEEFIRIGDLVFFQLCYSPSLLVDAGPPKP